MTVYEVIQVPEEPAALVIAVGGACIGAVIGWIVPEFIWEDPIFLVNLLSALIFGLAGWILALVALALIVLALLWGLFKIFAFLGNFFG